jgi:hypothetical protein
VSDVDLLADHLGWALRLAGHLLINDHEQAPFSAEDIAQLDALYRRLRPLPTLGAVGGWRHSTLGEALSIEMLDQGAKGNGSPDEASP